MDCLAIIPAKGTSRRIPRKNLALCAGTPLVVRSVETALAAGVFSEVWVSSEDEEILTIAATANDRVCLHRRRSQYSAEGVPVASVCAGFLGWYAEQYGELPESFCVLWPTSPLRTPEILREMWEKFKNEGLPSLHSVFAGPGASYTMIHDGTAIFMRTVEFLKRLSLDCTLNECWDKRHIVHDSIDVNTPEDLAEAERRLLAREVACPSR